MSNASKPSSFAKALLMIPLLLIAEACSSSTEPEIGDLDIQLTITPSSVSVGDTAHVELAVTNVTSHRLVLPANACLFNVEVAVSPATLGYLGLTTCSAAYISRELGPGDQQIFTLRFVGRAWVLQPTVTSSTYAWSVLAPGEYPLTGVLGEFRSPPATVAIVPEGS